MGVKAPASTRRRFWIESMSNEDKRSHLIVEHLETLSERRERDESAVLRNFLVAWSRATATGTKGMTIKVARRPKQPNSGVVCAVIPGVGAVPGIPIIIVPWHHNFDRIMRECGETPMFTHQPDRKTDTWGQPEQHRGGRPKLPKVNIQIVPVR